MRYPLDHKTRKNKRVNFRILKCKHTGMPVKASKPAEHAGPCTKCHVRLLLVWWEHYVHNSTFPEPRTLPPNSEYMNKSLIAARHFWVGPQLLLAVFINELDNPHQRATRKIVRRMLDENLSIKFSHCIATHEILLRQAQDETCKWTQNRLSSSHITLCNMVFLLFLQQNLTLCCFIVRHGPLS